MSFQVQRNECRVEAAVTVDCRLFHTLVAATRYAQLVEVGHTGRVVPDYVDCEEHSVETVKRIMTLGLEDT